ncbi:beta-ketoacyl synthase N-terminal-like domain-containing protein [Geobacter argillaceus]|uniref:Beta-ketoacyl synthase-like protein n=1 Tax=Geobacter argillaceus TaxID=345631 RepID=A0A562VM83_9BACT|nr:beta-ketoacyl synthase N-terminal-like domain-containing protein [Geobacter argillaceus]TWJ18998.1 beta-ketoacyl synthase-like protein [Geobacter argillaceus]
MTSPRTDIVVTGLAAVTAAGVGIAPLVSALESGTSRLTPVPGEIIGESGYSWGKADQFKAADYMPPLKARKFDRCSLLAVVGAGLALADAGLAKGEFEPSRAGIALGCGFGGIANSADFLAGYFTGGAEGLSPMLFPNTVANAAASNASIEHGLQGPNVTTVQRFCSAESAVAMACRFLEEGRADLMLAGGVDELTPLMMQGFRAMGQLDRFARGFGEGIGLLVLERWEYAKQRGAAAKGTLGDIRTIGRLLPGSEDEGAARLLPEVAAISRISVSGTVGECAPLLDRLPTGPRLDIGAITGRSLAMGGVAMAALLATQPAGQQGLHLAASPEGPYYAITFTGGSPG